MAEASVVDTNIPVPVEDLLEPKPAAGSEKSDIEKRFEALEAETKGLRTRLSEAENDARYWSQRARGETVTAREPEPESEDEPAAEDPAQDITPEQFLDVLSKEGVKGLRRFGFLTQADVNQQLREVERSADRKLAAAAQSVAVDQRLSREFPELLDDNQRVQRGEKPQSELFGRTSRIFRELVADDPSLKASPGAMLMAARQAKRELEQEKKSGGEDEGRPRGRQAERRDRIDSQRGERDRPNEIDDDTPRLPSQARDVIAALAHHGVGEDDYRRGSRNGR
jgi:hypothetical protein